VVFNSVGVVLPSYIRASQSINQIAIFVAFFTMVLSAVRPFLCTALISNNKLLCQAEKVVKRAKFFKMIKLLHLVRFRKSFSLVWRFGILHLTLDKDLPHAVLIAISQLVSSKLLVTDPRS